MARMEVFLVTPEREVWSGEASLVVARGSEGEVGILAGHAPMLVQLGIGPLFIQTESERLSAVVDGGFLHVVSHGDESRVDVLAEHAELAHEIDVAGARELERSSRERLGHEDSDDARRDLARATARLALGERA